MKTEIRKQILSKRARLSDDFTEACGENIFRNLLRSGLLPTINPMEKYLRDRARLFRQPPLVMSYSDIRNEVKTEPIQKYCFSAGIPLCLPVTAPPPSEREMEAFLITKDTLYVPDSFGIPVPSPETGTKADPASLSIVLVPGVAFDCSGNRLGFGKGYYDSFLPRAPQAVKIALAYDFQLTETIPAQPWDVKMDYIITESRIISCSAGSISITGK